MRWCGAAVALLALLAYGIGIGGDYVFDDVHSIVANTGLREPGAALRSLHDPSLFSASGQQMYRPVLLLSFVANLAVSEEAWALKAGNVLLHAFVAWMLSVWLRCSGVRSGAAALTAALFAVHPLASEAINLVSARSELLLATGLLLALVSHRRWQSGRAAVVSQLGMLVGTAIACGSKETGVVVPLVMAAQAWWLTGSETRGNWRRAVAGILQVVVVVVAYLVLRKVLLGQMTVDLLSRVGGDPTTGHGRTLVTQLATMGTLLPRALLQVAVPIGLSLDPLVVFRGSFLDPWVILGWASLFGLTIAAAWRGPTAAARRVGLCALWGSSLPWILVPLNMPLAEHRLYVPMLGLAAIVASLLPRLRTGRRGAPLLVTVTAVAVVGVGITLSARRSLDYRDEVGLWQSELGRNPASFQAWWGLGAAYVRIDDCVRAIEPLATANAMRPQHELALSHYTEALVRLPDGKEQPFRALAAARILAERRPDDPWCRTLLSRALLQMGHATGDRAHFEEAERVALSCLEIAPPKSFVYLLAAQARRCTGDLEAALAHADTSLGRGLDHVSMRLERARILDAMGRHAEARRELGRARQQAPFDPQVLHALREVAQPPR